MMSQTKSEFSDAISTIEEIIDDARNGRMFILVDHEDRENEGDLIIPAQMATPENINFMMRNGCGIVCLAMSPAICSRLGLEPQGAGNVDSQSTPFTQSIDARTGITTGTSAFDRARTVAIARGRLGALPAAPGAATQEGSA